MGDPQRTKFAFGVVIGLLIVAAIAVTGAAVIAYERGEGLAPIALLPLLLVVAVTALIAAGAAKKKKD